MRFARGFVRDVAGVVVVGFEGAILRWGMRWRCEMWFEVKYLRLVLNSGPGDGHF